MDTKSIKELLMDGVDPAALIKDITEEIEKAKKEIEKERETKAAASLNRVRHHFVPPLIDYAIALGIMDADKVTKEDHETIEKILIEVEKEFKESMRLTNALLSKPKNKTAGADIDEVIDNFLKLL